MESACKFAQKLSVPVLCAVLPFLAACGGGADNPLASLYTWISIISVDRPATAGTNVAVSIKARANSGGEISDGDIEWHFDQTSGKDIGNLTQTLSDGNHTATFNFQTPADAGTICFKLKVESSNHFYADSTTFCISVQ